MDIFWAENHPFGAKENATEKWILIMYPGISFITLGNKVRENEGRKSIYIRL